MRRELYSQSKNSSSGQGAHPAEITGEMAVQPFASQKCQESSQESPTLRVFSVMRLSGLISGEDIERHEYTYCSWSNVDTHMHIDH